MKAHGTITHTQIADFICGKDETTQQAGERIKNWTKEGLISAVGKKNPGRGRHRRYKFSALGYAFILDDLNKTIGTTKIKKQFKAIKQSYDDGLSQFEIPYGTSVRLVIDFNRIREKVAESYVLPEGDCKIYGNYLRVRVSEILKENNGVLAENA